MPTFPDTTPTPAYIGRFAPSPSGALHFGSLIAALASHLDARHHGGQWLLRIEDIDAPRNVPGSAEGIIASLLRLGLTWDGEIVRQSNRLAHYEAALDRLRRQTDAYACCCSRRELAAALLARDGSRIYPGTCRNGLPPGREARAWRVRVRGSVAFDDRVQGAQADDLESAFGDFVVLRADGQFAYQLAVVVDDADAGVTHVVRGADLLDSTGRQIYLQRRLGLVTPRYLHVPVVVNAAGEKLSKQTLATPIDDQPPARLLLAALRFLGQNPPVSLIDAPPPAILEWAVAHWSVPAIPPVRQIVRDEDTAPALSRMQS